MGKDPAVLFYTDDFLSGTYTMTDVQVGKYIRLLCLQHQKYELTKEDMLKICKTYDKAIFEKFIENEGKYYNQRMRDEHLKRVKYSESRRLNRQSKPNISKTYDKHMGNGDGNININEDNINVLSAYWNSTLTTPKQLEIELIQELHTKHGFDKTKRIIRELAENGFKRVRTMREALNPDGSIKPKNTVSQDSYTPEQWKDFIGKSETAQTRKELFNKYEFNESEKLWKRK